MSEGGAELFLLQAGSSQGSLRSCRLRRLPRVSTAGKVTLWEEVQGERGPSCNADGTFSWVKIFRKSEDFPFGLESCWPGGLLTERIQGGPAVGLRMEGPQPEQDTGQGVKKGPDCKV